MLLALLTALVATAAADKASFDCAARTLAIQYSAKVNPSLTAAHLQDLADGLNGAPEKAAACNVTVPAGLLAERAHLPRFRAYPLPAAGGSTFFVDPVAGSDSAAGTQAAPFLTVARALAATRAAPPGANAIVLRAGTHYLADVLTLTGADSGLTIQAFAGEEAWLSRGVPLAGLSWAQAPAPGPSGWQGPFAGSNAVYGGSEGFPFHVFGTTPDAATCQAACAANSTAGGPCTVYTWHSPKVAGFEQQCWFRLDHKWAPYPQVEHFSGYLATAPNVYTATLPPALAARFAAGSGIAGLRSPSGQRLIRARYPNADPEAGFGDHLQADSWTRTSVPIAPALQYEPDSPSRNSSYSFIHYQGGAGGICTVPGFGVSFAAGFLFSPLRPKF